MDLDKAWVVLKKDPRPTSLTLHRNLYSSVQETRQLFKDGDRVFLVVTPTLKEAQVLVVELDPVVVKTLT